MAATCGVRECSQAAIGAGPGRMAVRGLPGAARWSRLKPLLRWAWGVVRRTRAWSWEGWDGPRGPVGAALGRDLRRPGVFASRDRGGTGTHGGTGPAGGGALVAAEAAPTVGLGGGWGPGGGDPGARPGASRRGWPVLAGYTSISAPLAAMAPPARRAIIGTRALTALARTPPAKCRPRLASRKPLAKASMPPVASAPCA